MICRRKKKPPRRASVIVWWRGPQKKHGLTNAWPGKAGKERKAGKLRNDSASENRAQKNGIKGVLGHDRKMGERGPIGADGDDDEKDKQRKQ